MQRRRTQEESHINHIITHAKGTIDMRGRRTPSWHSDMQKRRKQGQGTRQHSATVTCGVADDPSRTILLMRRMSRVHPPACSAVVSSALGLTQCKYSLRSESTVHKPYSSISARSIDLHASKLTGKNQSVKKGHYELSQNGYG